MSVDANMMVRIGGDVSSLSGSLKKGSNDLDSFSGKAKVAAGNVAMMTGAALAAGAAIASALVVQSINGAREIQNMARVGGATTKVFTQMAHGALKYGIEQEKLSDILKDTQDKVGDFLTTGAGGMVDFFEQIAPKVGVTADQFKRLSGPDALQLYVSSLEKANLSQSEMTFYMEAIASDSSALLPLLRNNGEAMAKFARESDNLGRTLNDVDAAKLIMAQEAMGGISKSIQGIAQMVAVRLSPVLVAISEMLQDNTVKAGGFGEQVDKSFSFAIKAAGFVADSIAGIGRIIKVVSNSLMVFFNGFVEQFTSAVYGVLDLMDRIPGVTLGPAKEKVASEWRAINAQIATDLVDIQAALDKPLPSRTFEAFVASAESAGNKAAEAMAAAQAAANAQLPGSDESGGHAGKEAADEEQARIEALLAKYQAEQVMLAEHKQAMADIETAFKNGDIETLADKNSILESMEKDHQSKMMAMIRSGESGIESMKGLSNKNKIKLATGFFQEETAGLAQHSRKMFEINKAAALVNSAMSMYEGIAAGVRLGWPMAVPAVAWAAGTGIAQINAIRGQKFNGGGGGVAPSAATAEPAPVAQQGGGGGGGQQSRESMPRMMVEGVGADQFISGRQLGRMLQTAIDEGFVLEMAS